MLFLLASLLVDTAAAPCPRGALPAYAHNDYANARPLTDALALGYRGVEADVALAGGVLRLGHSTDEARRGAPLEATYLTPLAALVARCGALTADGTPFLLAVELKARSPAAADSLDALLARYAPRFERAAPGRSGLAVEVVRVGWYPTGRSATPAGVQQRLRRPTDVGPPGAWPTGVRLVSVDYGRTLGRPWRTRAGRRRWLAALREAKMRQPAAGAARAVRLRVHNVPVRAAVYRELLEAGVDLIGTKDLASTARVLTALAR